MTELGETERSSKKDRRSMANYDALRQRLEHVKRVNQ